MSISRTVTVASSSGLHARPANLFVQAVRDTGADVKISKAGKQVGAASILGLLSLGVACGDEVEITSEGEGAEKALDALVAFLEIDHDKSE